MRRAFTILELLAATALTALLMVALLHVISSLGRSQATLSQLRDTGGWRSDLLDTLRHDLSNATTASFAKDGITLSGHGSLDQSTLARGHDPVTVVYGLTTLRGRRWLVRTQSPRDRLSNDSPWSELLCADVTSFNIRPAGMVAANPSDSKTGPSTESVPPTVSVILEGTAGNIMNETLVLR